MNETELDSGPFLVVIKSASAKDFEFMTHSIGSPNSIIRAFSVFPLTGPLQFVSRFYDASVCTFMLYRSLLVGCNYALNYPTNNDEK